MRSVLAVMLVAVVLLVSSCGQTQAPSRPPGVSEAEWIPLSDAVGIVLADRGASSLYRTPRYEPFADMPRLTGTLMVQRNDTWIVVAMASDLSAGVVPLH